MANVCVRMYDSMYQVPTRILCILLIIFQGVILDYYLVTYKNIYWYSWIVADIALVLVFAMAFIISYKHLIVAKESRQRKIPIQTGSLPLGYFAWFVYSCLLAVRVAIIFKDFAWKLDEINFFGPNTLKISISLAAFVFLLLVMSHNDASPDTEREFFITELTGTVVFDVLDSVDVLDILFDADALEDFPVHLDTATITIACVNLILPTLPLMTLSRTHFGHRLISEDIKMLHKMMVVFFVNLPLLVIRMLMWHVLSKEISIFPVKNVIIIFLVFHDIYRRQRKRLEDKDIDDIDGEGNEMDPQGMGDGY